MPRPSLPPLSRRERQIMDVIYSLGQASVAEVLAGLPDPPSYSAVRALLRILVEKGHLKYRSSAPAQRGAPKYIYLPVTPRTHAAKSALRRVLDTFFAGSVEKALAVHLADPASKLTPEELQRLAALIQKASKLGDQP